MAQSNIPDNEFKIIKTPKPVRPSRVKLKQFTQGDRLTDNLTDINQVDPSQDESIGTTSPRNEDVETSTFFDNAEETSMAAVMRWMQEPDADGFSANEDEYLKENIENLANEYSMTPKQKDYLMNAKGEDQIQYRLSKIQGQQEGNLRMANDGAVSGLVKGIIPEIGNPLNIALGGIGAVGVKAGAMGLRAGGVHVGKASIAAMEIAAGVGETVADYGIRESIGMNQASLAQEVAMFGMFTAGTRGLGMIAHRGSKAFNEAKQSRGQKRLKEASDNFTGEKQSFSKSDYLKNQNEELKRQAQGDEYIPPYKQTKIPDNKPTLDQQMSFDFPSEIDNSVIIHDEHIMEFHKHTERQRRAVNEAYLPPEKLSIERKLNHEADSAKRKETFLQGVIDAKDKAQSDFDAEPSITNKRKLDKATDLHLQYESFYKEPNTVDATIPMAPDIMKMSRGTTYAQSTGGSGNGTVQRGSGYWTAGQASHKANAVVSSNSYTIGEHRRSIQEDNHQPSLLDNTDTPVKEASLSRRMDSTDDLASGQINARTILKDSVSSDINEHLDSNIKPEELVLKENSKIVKELSNPEKPFDLVGPVEIFGPWIPTEMNNVVPLALNVKSIEKQIRKLQSGIKRIDKAITTLRYPPKAVTPERKVKWIEGRKKQLDLLKDNLVKMDAELIAAKSIEADMKQYVAEFANRKSDPTVKAIHTIRDSQHKIDKQSITNKEINNTVKASETFSKSMEPSKLDNNLIKEFEASKMAFKDSLMDRIYTHLETRGVDDATIKEDLDTHVSEAMDKLDKMIGLDDKSMRTFNNIVDNEDLPYEELMRRLLECI